MPEFAPSESKTAIVPIIVVPSGLSCEAELWLGPDEATKVATSGLVAFTSTGLPQSVSLPITMPDAAGTYHVFIDVHAEDILVAAYQAIEDVWITSAVPGLTLYEHCNVGAKDSWSIYGNTWRVQTFTPEIGHRILAVRLQLCRYLYPGLVNVGIRRTGRVVIDGRVYDGIPVGEDLCSGTFDCNNLPEFWTEVRVGEWCEIPLGEGYNLLPGVQYAIVVTAPDAPMCPYDEELRQSAVCWSMTDVRLYTRGWGWHTHSGGERWSRQWQYMFEEWGLP